MWYMNEELEMIRKMAAEFTANEVVPATKEMEANNSFPAETIRKAGEIGITGLMYPEEVGGSGIGAVAFGLALEEISKENTMIGLHLALHGALGNKVLQNWGTPDQKEKILKPSVLGETVFCGAVCEPTGFNQWMDFKVNAVQDGDDWILNGNKIFCTESGVAEWYYTLAVTGEIKPETMEGLTVFLIHKDNPGIKFGRPEHKLGWHGSNTAGVYFKDCRVSKNDILGEVNKGYAAWLGGIYSNGGADIGLMGVLCLGGAEGVFEKTKKYVKERMHHGASLFDSYQVVRHQLVDLWIEIESLRGMVFEVLDGIDRGENMTALASAVKVYGAKVFEHVASECVLLHGGNGLIVENDIERYYRDAKCFAIGGGTVPTLKDAIAMMI